MFVANPGDRRQPGQNGWPRDHPRDPSLVTKNLKTIDLDVKPTAGVPRPKTVSCHWLVTVPRKPAIRAAGIEPERRIYDLRRTYATFSLAAGVSLFTLSRRMGRSVEMIDRT
jgi:hypothetical protein